MCGKHVEQPQEVCVFKNVICGECCKHMQSAQTQL